MSFSSLPDFDDSAFTWTHLYIHVIRGSCNIMTAKIFPAKQHYKFCAFSTWIEIASISQDRRDRPSLFKNYLKENDVNGVLLGCRFIRRRKSCWSISEVSWCRYYVETRILKKKKEKRAINNIVWHFQPKCKVILLEFFFFFLIKKGDDTRWLGTAWLKFDKIFQVSPNRSNHLCKFPAHQS